MRQWLLRLAARGKLSYKDIAEDAWTVRAHADLQVSYLAFDPKSTNVARSVEAALKLDEFKRDEIYWALIPGTRRYTGRQRRRGLGPLANGRDYIWMAFLLPHEQIARFVSRGRFFVADKGPFRFTCCRT